jgi:hypothetical protein
MKQFWNTLKAWTGLRSDVPPPVLTEATEPNETWIGRICQTVTPLRLAGFVEYQGLRLEAESADAVVPKGRYVEVVGVIFHNRLVVRQLPDRQIYRWMNLIKG